MVDGLKQERTRIAVQNQTQAAELDARNAEYQDLPRTPLEFMPVTIEVAVTETESEKKAQLALADIIGKQQRCGRLGGRQRRHRPLSKSVAGRPQDRRRAAESAATWNSARARYYDALVGVEAARQASERRLAAQSCIDER